MSIRHYTNEEFLEMYLEAADFLDECLECRRLLDKYDEFKNPFMNTSMKDLKDELYAINKTWEIDEFGLLDKDNNKMSASASS